MVISYFDEDCASQNAIVFEQHVGAKNTWRKEHADLLQ